MAVEIDIEALLKTVDEFADRAEDSRNFTWFAKSNSLWRSAMKESAVLKGIYEQLVGKLKIPKMGILILLTINHGFLMLHMYFWEFSVQSICWHFIFLYCPYLYVEQCVEIVSRNKVFVTSESERVNVIFAVLEKSWKSPQKLFLKKGTNPDNNNNNSLYCRKIKVH